MERVLPGIDSRLDFYFAQICLMIDAVGGGKRELKDFLHPCLQRMIADGEDPSEKIVMKARMMEKMFPKRFRKAGS